LRNRVAIGFAVAGDVRFISHRDTVRLFERALARAGVPVRFTEGFNPHPKLTIVLPRTVGVSSSDEMLLLDLASPLESTEVASMLSRTLPTGVTLLSCEAVAEGDRRLPERVDYELAIPHSESDDVSRRAVALLSRTFYAVERGAAPDSSKRAVDIRPFISEIEVDTDRLRWTQHVTPRGSVRPNEMLEALGLSPGTYVHRLHRLRVVYRA